MMGSEILKSVEEKGKVKKVKSWSPKILPVNFIHLNRFPRARM